MHLCHLSSVIYVRTSLIYFIPKVPHPMYPLMRFESCVCVWPKFNEPFINLHYTHFLQYPVCEKDIFIYHTTHNNVRACGNRMRMQHFRTLYPMKSLRQTTFVQAAQHTKRASAYALVVLCSSFNGSACCCCVSAVPLCSMLCATLACWLYAAAAFSGNILRNVFI